MIVQLEHGISEERRAVAINALRSLGLQLTEVQTQYRGYVVCLIDKPLDIRSVGAIPGVVDVHRVSDTYQLVSRSWRVHPTTIDLGDGVTITEGGGHHHDGTLLG